MSKSLKALLFPQNVPKEEMRAQKAEKMTLSIQGQDYFSVSSQRPQALNTAF